MHPDSEEFSSVGGWVATRASGMKQQRYGNIEQMCLGVNVVAPAAVTAKPDDSSAPEQQQVQVLALKKSDDTSTNIGLRDFFLGSEGCFGCITSVKLAIHPLPEVVQYEAILFPDWEHGIALLERLARAPSTAYIPASIRLVDNQQFRFGQACKAEVTSAVGKAKDFMKRQLVTKVLGFDPAVMCAATVVFEGGKEEVAMQKAYLNELRKQYFGIWGGSEAGANGYRLTYAIAYIRDLADQMGILGESFETSVPWSRVPFVIKSVKAFLQSGAPLYEGTNYPCYQDMGFSLEDTPEQLVDAAAYERTSRNGNKKVTKLVENSHWISYRVSQLYKQGVCIYFYMALPVPPKYIGPTAEINKAKVEYYEIVERGCRRCILDAGGSLSHHHGIGKIRRDFASDVFTPQAADLLNTIRGTLDPNQVLQAGNGIFQ
ncbi:unnamed protein product [Amoebophrya sp. A25]|nr:unnamed protein product [Amoebophrya sp. A25]|eukprot:GSA25T00011013001.1